MPSACLHCVLAKEKSGHLEVSLDHELFFSTILKGLSPPHKVQEMPNSLEYFSFTFSVFVYASTCQTAFHSYTCYRSAVNARILGITEMEKIIHDILRDVPKYPFFLISELEEHLATYLRMHSVVHI